MRWKKTDEMKWTGFSFRSGHRLPVASIDHNPDGEEVESDIWLSENNAPRWSLRQSAVYMPYYERTLVLIEAEREFDIDEPDDPEPSRIPSFS